MELGPYIFYVVIGGLLAGSGVLACGALAGITAKGGGARIGRTLLAVAFTAAGAAVLMGDRPEGSFRLSWWVSGPDRYSMLLPDTLSGRLRSTDPEQVELAADAEADIRNSRRSVATVAVGYYGSNHDKDLVYVEAVSYYSAPRRRMNLQTLLKMEISSWNEAGNAYRADITISVDAGKLGGTAACAELTVDDIPLTICVWVGAVTEGWIIWYYEKLEDVKSQFIVLREQIEAP